MGALLARQVGGWWQAEVIAAVLVVRVLWQFRFHRTCDGRHLATLLIDDPVVATEAAGRRWSESSRGVRTWRVLSVVGVLVEVVLVVVWLLPGVGRLLGLV